MAISNTDPRSGSHKPIPRHFIILPTNHEDVLRLKDKLLSFRGGGWNIRDFGAFGAFDCGFLIIEIYDLEGYHTFKRDMCSLIEQGLKYVYPEHIVCWL